MRSFIAPDLPNNIKNKLSQVQDNLKTCDLNFKWAGSQNLHLTLKFLGEIKHKKLEEVKLRLVELSRNYESFSLKLKKFGFFPNEKNPKVFFIKTSRNEILKTISEDLEDRLDGMGFKRETRFRSHITLARIKSPKNIECLKERLINIEPNGAFPIKELTLFKSTLTNHGPIYEDIFNVSLI